MLADLALDNGIEQTEVVKRMVILNLASIVWSRMG
jgi:hypothetical protein